MPQPDGRGLSPVIAKRLYLSKNVGARWAALADIPSMAVPPFGVVSSAPTITYGINGGSIPGFATTQIGIGDDTYVTRIGAWTVDSNVSGGASYKPDRAGGRLDFIYQGSKFCIRVNRQSSSVSRGPAIFVDGQLITTLPWPEFAPGLNNASTSPQWMTVDFGSDTVTYSAMRVSVATGGTSGYAVGDTVTLTSTNAITPTVLRVTSVNGSGVIQSVQTQTPGSYSTQPANAASQASTSGAGVGTPTFNIFWRVNHSTLAARRITIVADAGITLGSIGISANDKITPFTMSGPKLLIAGDSFGEYQLATYANGTWADQTAKRIGLFDNYVRYCTSGRGYVQSTPFSLDIAGIVAQAPDLIVIGLGTNDYQNSVAQNTLQAEVTSDINSLLTQLPNVLICVVGAMVDDSSGNYNTYISNGVAACNSTRVGFVNFFTASGGYGVTSSSPFNSRYGTSTDIHPSQLGQDMISKILAPRIVQCFQGLSL